MEISGEKIGPGRDTRIKIENYCEGYCVQGGKADVQKTQLESYTLNKLENLRISEVNFFLFFQYLFSGSLRFCFRSCTSHCNPF